MKLSARTGLRLVAPIAVSVGLAFGDASAASAATVQASGVQSPVSSGPCLEPSALASYTMDGSLIGCWYTDTFNTSGFQPSGTIQATGTEHFVGCLDLDADQACGGGDPQGTLSFSYQFTGKYTLMTLAEIHGRCEHPITAGTGDFAGARGVISFKDDVATGTSPYRGPITLPD